MDKKNVWSDENLIKILENGGVGVMPTDTLYGIVGMADNPDTVNRIYNTRQRSPEKPCIILIGDTKDLKNFSVSLSDKQKSEISKYWPGPTSIILDCQGDQEEKLHYLHRGTHTLAFRLPDSAQLRELILKVGPLIAPSANIEGMPPAKNIEEAKNYFQHQIDIYVPHDEDDTELTSKPSKIIKIDKEGDVTVVRS
ncbi:MAG: L-threonylcarbamoyladenylate synthase [Candidatus Paceibacterota bacterium]